MLPVEICLKRFHGGLRSTPAPGITFRKGIRSVAANTKASSAERLARRTKRSRSEVYSRALAEYVARHAPDRVTEAMDRALTEIDQRVDKFARAASRRILERSDW